MDRIYFSVILWLEFSWILYLASPVILTQFKSKSPNVAQCYFVKISEMFVKVHDMRLNDLQYYKRNYKKVNWLRNICWSHPAKKWSFIELKLLVSKYSTVLHSISFRNLNIFLIFIFPMMRDHIYQAIFLYRELGFTKHFI